ncbi:J domain-containing protein [Streptomyces himalayensis]|uniref:J domain-containing protein n=1 Tax=Streptomyces himalayensis TaxID=2820085 RepID=UPI0028B238B0|nr:J domain-containing protein [Streptomyces himalayensis]
MSPVAGRATPHPQRDLYAVLGVEPTASGGQITSAYRKLVRALHPDANPGQEATGERFAEVVSAYGTLRDPVLREAYDAERSPTSARSATNGPQGRRGRPVRISVRVRTAEAPGAADAAMDRPGRGAPCAEPSWTWSRRTEWPYDEESAPGPSLSDPWDLLWQWIMRW